MEKTVPLGGHQENETQFVMNMFSIRTVFYIWYIRENCRSAKLKIPKTTLRIFSEKLDKLNNSSVGYRMSRRTERNLKALFILSVWKVTLEI